MGDHYLTKSLKDMASWRAGARMGTMMILPHIEQEAMDELRERASTNELAEVSGLRSQMPVTLAVGESVIKCPSPLNVFKDTYDHGCY